MGAAVLSGCTAHYGAANAAAVGTGHYSGQLSVPLYTELPDNAVFIVGFQKGFYRQQDLSLKPINFLQGSDVIRAVVSSSNLGVASPISGMVARTAGLDQIRIIGTCMGRSTIYYMVKPNSPIKRISDLKGKKVGVNSPTSITTYLGMKMVERAGLDPQKDVDLINVKSAGESATALANGVVDCAWSSPPLSVELVQKGQMRLLVDTATLFPDFLQTVLYTTESFLKADPDATRRILKATSVSQAFIRDHTEEAAQIYAAHLQIEPKIAYATLKELSSGYRIDISHAGFELNVAACRQLGLLKKPIPYDEIVVDRYVKEVSAT